MRGGCRCRKRFECIIVLNGIQLSRYLDLYTNRVWNGGPIPLLLHKTPHPVLIHHFPEFQKQYIMISNLSQPLIAMDYIFPGLTCI